MKRRWIPLLMMCLLVFMTACSGSGPNPENNQTSSAANGGSSRDGIAVYVGTNLFSSSLDPVKGAMSYGYSFTNCALLRVNQNSEYEGDMAEKWDISSDSLVYTFSLKKGVLFSDGSELTAKDVVFTYETVKKNQAENENVDLTRLKSVRAVDEYTVEFTLSEPYSPFLDAVASLGIVPAHSYDSQTFDRYPVGTGPWKVVQYDPNQQIIVEPNEHYYEGVPSIAKVTLVYMDDEAAFAAARSGQLDVVMVGANHASESVEGMRAQLFDTMDIRMISLPVLTEQQKKDAQGKVCQVGNHITADESVRKALAIGIDRKQIIENAFNGVGKPAYGFTDNLIWAETNAYKDNQKEEAKALLEKAGWKTTNGDGVREKNGIKCEFDVYATGGDQERYLLAAAVAEDAAQLGIQINVKTATWDEAANLQNSSGIVWGWGQYSPTVLQSMFSSRLFLSGGYDNVVGYQNSQVDSLIDQALSANSQEKAIKAWKQAQTLANEDNPYLYIANIEHCYFVSDSLDVSVNTQIAHPHGHGAPVICNMKDWTLKAQ